MVWIVDVRSLSLRPTGVGMYAYRLLRKFVKDNPGVRFVLLSDICESHELRELEWLGCEVRTYGLRIFKSSTVLRYFSWMKRQVAEVRPDVFWEPNNILPFRPKGVGRVIVTMHDVFGLRDWSWRHAIWHIYYRFSFWRTLRNVTEIWYNSAVTQRQVEECASTSKLVSRITRPIAEVPMVESIETWKWPRPYFLYVGNVEGRKGADILVAAYRRYKESAKGENAADLVVAGSVRDVQVPEEEGFVRLGYVDDATKYSLMKSCLAMVVPSRDEGYGMQLAEALKLGVRIIASDVPVFEEVVDDQGSLFQDVTWLAGFAAGTDEARMTMLANALAAKAKSDKGRT